MKLCRGKKTRRRKFHERRARLVKPYRDIIKKALADWKEGVSILIPDSEVRGPIVTAQEFFERLEQSPFVAKARSAS